VSEVIVMINNDNGNSKTSLECVDGEERGY
jgi:hypothetical protein